MDRNKYVVQCRKTLGVALRKESVDRNKTLIILTKEFDGSLSARRAWIEIICTASKKYPVIRRSPQGERG